MAINFAVLLALKLAKFGCTLGAAFINAFGNIFGIAVWICLPFVRFDSAFLKCTLVMRFNILLACFGLLNNLKSLCFQAPERAYSIEQFSANYRSKNANAHVNTPLEHFFQKTDHVQNTKEIQSFAF